MTTCTLNLIAGDTQPIERLVDGPDMWHEGTPRADKPYTGPHRDIGAPAGLNVLSQHRTVYAHEDPDVLRSMAIYHVRHHPESYDTFVRTLIENARVKVAEHLDMWDWDCESCHTAVLTSELHDACPSCGA